MPSRGRDHVQPRPTGWTRSIPISPRPHYKFGEAGVARARGWWAGRRPSGAPLPPGFSRSDI